MNEERGGEREGGREGGRERGVREGEQEGRSNDSGCTCTKLIIDLLLNNHDYVYKLHQQKQPIIM